MSHWSRGTFLFLFSFFIDTTDRTKDIKCCELSKLGITGSKLHKIPFTVVYTNDPKMRNIRTLLVCTNTKTRFWKQPLNDVTKGAASQRYYFAQVCDHTPPGYVIVPPLIAALFTSPEKHADSGTKHQF